MSDPSVGNDDQAKLLVALQDLDRMIQDTEDKEKAAEFEKMGFSLDGVEALHTARNKLTDRIKPQLLNRYQRVSKAYERTVVPVAGNLCTGCLAKVPTSFRYEKNVVVTCESCGRMLYFT